MTLPDLLIDLGRAGVTIRDAGGGVGFTPRSAFTTTRASALAVHKPALLVLLVDGYIPFDEEGAYIVGERLGVADDLNMPTTIGTPAWLVAVGEALAPPPTIADRLAGIVASVLGVQVTPHTIPLDERWPGEPDWKRSEPKKIRRN